MKYKNPYIEITEKNARRCLNLLTSKFTNKSSFNFCVNYCQHDNPVLRCGIYDIKNNYIFTPKEQIINLLKLSSIRENGKFIVGERDIALWNLSTLYENCAIEFKCETMITLEDYAFWTRNPIELVERIFCEDVIYALMKYVKYDPKWRIYTGFDWIEIDPWKFAIELDLN